MKRGSILIILLLGASILLTACEEGELEKAMCADTSKDPFWFKVWCKMKGNGGPSQPQASASGCTDYDGGLDYYKASFTISGKSEYRSDDYCEDSHTLMESYCFTDKNNDVRWAIKSTECFNGCKNGACERNKS